MLPSPSSGSPPSRAPFPTLGTVTSMQPTGAKNSHESCGCGLAFHRGLPSQRLTTLLVGSYPTFAPLPVLGSQPSAVCFCGTILAVTRTGLSPAVCSSESPDFPHPAVWWRQQGRDRLPLLSLQLDPTASSKPRKSRKSVQTPRDRECWGPHAGFVGSDPSPQPLRFRCDPRRADGDPDSGRCSGGHSSGPVGFFEE
jgi:hypothetical protein